MRAGSSLAIVACLVAASAAEPSYHDVKEAAVLFERGRALLGEAKYGEACAAFAHSHQLDPQAGTLYNLAGCFLKRGMLVSAWNAYRDLAAHDRNPRRRDDAAQHAKQLEATLPRLAITAPSGWTVTLNGVDVTGRVGVDEPVDPGAYEVVATARNEPPFRTTVTVAADGKLTTVAVRSKHALDVVDPFGIALPAERPVLAAAPAAGDPERARIRMYGKFAIGGGAALLVGGLALGKNALTTQDDADALCSGQLVCADLVHSQELHDRARGRAYAAIGLAVSGAALGGFGAWLYWKRADAVQIHAGTSGSPAGVTLSGRF